MKGSGTKTLKKIFTVISIICVLGMICFAQLFLYYPISGKISGPAGVSLGGRIVRFYKTDPSVGVATAETADDGSFTINAFDIFPDTLTVGVDYTIDVPFINGYGIGPKQGQYISGSGYKEISAEDVDLTLAATTEGLASIGGNVKDNSGNPVQDATVTAAIRSVATAANGNYTLSSLPAGSYRVNVNKAGFALATKEVTLNVGETKSGVDFILTPIAAQTQIKVLVLDASLNTPIAGVDVQVVGGAVTKTDASGTAVLTVAAGTHQVKASKKLYVTKVETVSVNDNEIKELTIKLKYSLPPTLKNLRFGERLYQGVLVAKGDKFIVSTSPKITAILTNEPESGISTATISVVLDAGAPSSQTFSTKDFEISGLKTSRIAEADKVNEMSIKLTIPADSALKEGSHTFDFMVENDYGLLGSYSATVEVMGGPVRLVSIPLTFPSPFSISQQGKVYIQYVLSQDCDIQIYLADVGGMRIKRFDLDAGKEGGTAGLNKVSWDGTTDQGYKAGNAIYVGTIVARKEGKLLGKFKLTIVD